MGAGVLSRVEAARPPCVLFGDGLGAVVLRRSESPGARIGARRRRTRRGDPDDSGGGSAEPASHASVDANDHVIVMLERSRVFKRAVVEMAGACRRSLEKSGFGPEDVDLLIPHQANARIMIAVAEA